MPRPTTSERLLTFLRAHGYEPAAPPQRTFAGVHQRSAGAWSWYVELDGHRGIIGSQWSMGEVVRFKDPQFSIEHRGQTTIDPS